MRKLGFAYKFAGSPTGTKFMHPTGFDARSRRSRRRGEARSDSRPLHSRQDLGGLAERGHSLGHNPSPDRRGQDGTAAGLRQDALSLPCACEIIARRGPRLKEASRWLAAQ